MNITSKAQPFIFCVVYCWIGPKWVKMKSFYSRCEYTRLWGFHNNTNSAYYIPVLFLKKYLRKTLLQTRRYLCMSAYRKIRIFISRITRIYRSLHIFTFIQWQTDTKNAPKIMYIKRYSCFCTLGFRFIHFVQLSVQIFRCSKITQA